MRKSKVIILLCVIMIMMITSCGCFGSQIDEDDAAEQLVGQVFDCINYRDAESLKSLFSQSLLEAHDLDKEIEGLFEVLDGKIVSYDDFDSGISSEKVRNGQQTLLTIEPWVSNVKTDTGKIYEVRLYAYVINEDDEDKVGIIGLKIIVDDETEYVVGDR